MRYPRKSLTPLRVLAFFLCACCAQTVFAQSLADKKAATGADWNEPLFSFSGFATAGLVHSTEGEADFLAHDLQKRGAGRNANWSAEVDSRAGVQLDIRPAANWSAVLQVTSEQRYDGAYDPEVEWANIKYQITPDLSVRAGRIVLPLFLHSDSRKVGYAMPWVRPPVEVYSLIPLSRLDGVDASWRQYFGEVGNTFQLIYGKSSARLVEGGELKAEDGWLLKDTLDYGFASLQLSYLRTHGSITSYIPLFNNYRNLAVAVPALAPQVARVINDYEPDNTIFDIFTLGASYNPGKWFVMGEYGLTDTHSVYGKRSAWYGSAGYRIGAFTPYVTYAASRLDSNASDPGVTHPLAATLNARLNDRLSAAPVQKTIALGLRWDCARNVALKAQYDYTDVAPGSPGSLGNESSQYQRGGKFRLYSLAIDVLF